MAIPREDFEEHGIDPDAIEFPGPEQSDHGVKEAEDASVSDEMVAWVLKNGKIIEAYPPTGRGWTFVVMGWIEGENLSEPKPLHVVAAPKEDRTVIVTAYDPSKKPHMWNDDYTKRL